MGVGGGFGGAHEDKGQAAEEGRTRRWSGGWLDLGEDGGGLVVQMAG